MSYLNKILYKLPDKLKEFRINAGLSIQAASRQSNLDPTTISRFENRASDIISLTTLLKLLECYGMRLMDVDVEADGNG